jgi:AcrR family transcriptional regulator
MISETQARILRAALELFAERGFAATTTAEIARAAGVAEKTIFANFQSKEALYEQTLTPATLQLLVPDATMKMLEALDADWADLEELLVTLMRNRVQVFREHPAKFKLIAQEILLRPERARPFMDKFSCEIAPAFDRALDSLKERGKLGAFTNRTVRGMTASVLLGYAIQRFIVFPEADWDDEAEIATMARALTRGFEPPKTQERIAPTRPGAAAPSLRRRNKT